MIGAIGLGLGLAQSGFSLFTGIKAKKEAKAALANLDVPTLENVAENIQISTVGSDFLAEQNSRTTSQMSAGARNAGIRGVLSGIPKIQSFSNDANREGQAYLDNQVQDRNMLYAQDEQNLRGMRENRYQQELAGIGQQMESGQAYVDQGIRGAAAAINYGARNIDFSGDGSYNEQQGLPDVGAPTMGGSFYTKNTLNQVFSPSQIAMGRLGGNNSIYGMYQPKTGGV